MVMPKEFRESTPLNPRLVTKTSLPDPKGAIASAILLWIANERPASIIFGIDSAEGAMNLDPDNNKRLEDLFTANHIVLSDNKSVQDLFAKSPLLSSQIEALKMAFELIWHLGELRFEDNNLNASAERKGGKRFKKRLAFSNNLDIIWILIQDDLHDYLEVFVDWINKSTSSHLNLEHKLITMLAVFAEVSFYKTGKGEKSMIYVPSGVYEQIIAGNEVELSDGDEVQGSTRIFKTLIMQGLNPYLQRSGQSVKLTDGTSTEELKAYEKRAKTTLGLSRIEIRKRIDHTEETPKPNGPLSRNLIYFGAPGTGKSHNLEQKAKGNFAEKNITRITFHPDYSYASFVGSLKPQSGEDEKGQHQIYYKFVPGPFIETYVNAINNPDEKYLLIIEEINRANPAAVFGDIFQLLDRNADGNSDYPIKTSKELREFLDADLTGINHDKKEGRLDILSIPPNMYIWATMNSADQGVFPMDTAFKRRWDFNYVGIDDGESLIADKVIPLGHTGRKAKWNDLRKEINNVLLQARINEDKLIGPFFIDPSLLTEDNFVETFKSKVLLYLIEDAAKTKKDRVFNSGTITYSIVAGDFDTEGEKIFKGINDIAINEDDKSETDDGTNRI